MAERKILNSLVTFSFLLLSGLSLVRDTWEQSTVQELCQPTEYTFENATVTFTDDNCSQLSSDIQAPSGINPTDYTRCTNLSRLTDSELGPEELTANDSRVYRWEIGENLVLFTYNAPPKLISAVTVYYYRNNDDIIGLPKIRFCAVPENSEVWNASDPLNNDCRSQNEIRPDSDVACSNPPCRENVTIAFNYVTNNVLLEIAESKNFQLVVSEVQFFTAVNVTESTTTVGVGDTTGINTLSDTEETTTVSGGARLYKITHTLTIYICIGASLFLLYH